MKHEPEVFVDYWRHPWRLVGATLVSLAIAPLLFVVVLGLSPRIVFHELIGSPLRPPQ